MTLIMTMTMTKNKVFTQFSHESFSGVLGGIISSFTGEMMFNPSFTFWRILRFF